LHVLHQVPRRQDGSGEPHGGNGNKRTHVRISDYSRDLIMQRAKNALMRTGRGPSMRRDGKKVAKKMFRV
jgi:hypothetical protein